MLGQAHNELYDYLKEYYVACQTRGVPCADEKYFSWPYAQIFVATNIKVLYCPIAKNACSSLKKLMVELSDIENKAEILKGDIHTNTDRDFTGIQLKDLNNEQIEEALESDRYLRFAILREPRSRLLSAYWEKFVVNRVDPAILGDTLPIIGEISSKTGRAIADPHVGINFHDFVHYVISQHPDSLNAHWKPQYTYLEGINYNAFYDLADLSKLFMALRERAGRAFSLPTMNITNSGKGTAVKGAMFMGPEELLSHGSIDISSFFDASMAAAIDAFYAKDYELLDKCR